MKVLHFIHSLDSAIGGPARSVPGLGLALERAGVDISIASWVPPSDDLETQPVGYVRLSREGWRSRLRGHVKEQDLIHVHGVWDPIVELVCHYARAERVPYIVTPRGSLDQWSLTQKRFKKWLAWSLYQKRTLQRAAGIHVTSSSEMEQVKVLGITTRILLAPNAVDLPELSVRSGGVGSVCRQACFISRIHEKKGVDLLLDAWSAVAPQGWELTIAGPGATTDVDRLRSRLKDLPSVSYVGAISDREKWTLYSRSELFILPTHTENFGIVIAEAMASGCAVITTTGAPWQVVRDVEAGWWIERELPSLVAAIDSATRSNVDELREMGRRGRRVIETAFTWPAVAEQVKALYESILDAG